MNKFQQKIQLLADRVAIEQFGGKSTTKSGLIIPESCIEKDQKGKVIALGPGTPNVKMELEIGEIVHFGRQQGVPIKVDNKEYLILRYDQIGWKEEWKY